MIQLNLDHFSSSHLLSQVFDVYFASDQPVDVSNKINMLSTVKQDSSSINDSCEFVSKEQLPPCPLPLRPQEGTHDEEVASNASDSSVGSNIEDLLEKEPSPIKLRGRILKNQNYNSILIGCGELLSDISEGSDVMDLDNNEEDEEHDLNSISRYEDVSESSKLNESLDSMSTTISISSDIEEELKILFSEDDQSSECYGVDKTVHQDFDDAILKPFMNTLKLEDDVSGPSSQEHFHQNATCSMNNSVEVEKPTFSVNIGRPLKRPAERGCIRVKRFKM
ncbi:uncharacterized protein [Leptinotarsa decemlineata]|uniref:uncharacterized protein n=1 Tax=Leptinotarsa decemlineata TaxID=7539 RepID=UPI003D3061B9